MENGTEQRSLSSKTVSLDAGDDSQLTWVISPQIINLCLKVLQLCCGFLFQEPTPKYLGEKRYRDKRYRRLYSTRVSWNGYRIPVVVLDFTSPDEQTNQHFIKFELVELEGACRLVLVSLKWIESLGIKTRCCFVVVWKIDPRISIVVIRIYSIIKENNCWKNLPSIQRWWWRPVVNNKNKWWDFFFSWRLKLKKKINPSLSLFKYFT